MYKKEEIRRDNLEAFLITGMVMVALFAIWIMKKIEPEDKIYPAWALFVVILFALVVIFAR